MGRSGHEQLAQRLASILLKLNQGEHLDPALLAEEFCVHKRTIQRDLQDRLGFLPLETTASGKVCMAPAYLGRITMPDIERFATLAGLAGLFPGLGMQFIRELFDSRLQDTMEVHGGSYEDLRHRTDDFRVLQQAINRCSMVRFTYIKPDEEKRIDVAPYRLVNHTGVWYLAATDAGTPKSYSFSKIASLQCLDAPFTPDPAVQQMLEQEDSIWLNQKKTEVVMAVAPAAALYFRRRKLVAQQVIEKELEDGGLLVSGKFAHANQILPIVRYWIPHVRIVSPESWQGLLEDGLRNYLQG